MIDASIALDDRFARRVMESVAGFYAALDEFGLPAVTAACELLQLDRLVRRYPATARKALALHRPASVNQGSVPGWVWSVGCIIPPPAPTSARPLKHESCRQGGTAVFGGDVLLVISGLRSDGYRVVHILNGCAFEIVTGRKASQ